MRVAYIDLDGGFSINDVPVHDLRFGESEPIRLISIIHEHHLHLLSYWLV